MGQSRLSLDHSMSVHLKGVNVCSGHGHGSVTVTVCNTNPDLSQGVTSSTNLKLSDCAITISAQISRAGCAF